MTDIVTTPPIAAELETLAKDCEECAEGSEAESKYDDRRAWQAVAYRIRHAISRLTTPPLTASWLSWWDSLPRGGYTPEAIERWLERARPLVEAARKGAPPPDEIAGLIEGLEHPTYQTAQDSIKKAAAAFRALAQENERLTHALSFAQSDLCKGAIVEAAHARIRELEAIVAQIQPPADIGDNCTAELAVKCANLEAERDAILAQLPDGMKHCTIQFKECEKGHGRLTATNWTDHGCGQCERDAIRALNAELRDWLIAAVEHIDNPLIEKHVRAILAKSQEAAS